MTRDFVTAAVRGAALVPNSVLRVMSDAKAGLAHLVLLYVDWVSKQLLPDTAEDEFLERHGSIWLVNSDGSIGRKSAALAEGTATAEGTLGTIIPAGTVLTAPSGVEFEAVEEVTLSGGPTDVPVRAVVGGVAGNQEPGTALTLREAISGVTGSLTVVTLDGGVDQESIEDLRVRVLERIRKPPMGGAKDDYEHWAKAVPGVTRAWCAPNEMGIGTVTVRVMFDVVRAEAGGFPTGDDLEAVTEYLDTVRPVCIKDRWVLSPLAQNIDFTITDLSEDDAATRALIELAVAEMLTERAAPGQTIYAVWVNDAISSAIGDGHFAPIADDFVMDSAGHMAVLGTISYDP
jgi:uncharacterized phage protein gp47/JayE